MFVSRLDTTNAYHNTEHVVSVFTALAAVRIPKDVMWQGMQVGQRHIGCHVCLTATQTTCNYTSSLHC